MADPGHMGCAVYELRYLVFNSKQSGTHQIRNETLEAETPNTSDVSVVDQDIHAARHSATFHHYAVSTTLQVLSDPICHHLRRASARLTVTPQTLAEQSD